MFEIELIVGRKFFNVNNQISITLKWKKHLNSDLNHKTIITIFCGIFVSFFNHNIYFVK